MYDVGYMGTIYSDSFLKIADDSCNDLDQLKRRLNYSETAIEFHNKESNLNQVALFKASVDNLKNKIIKFSKA